MAVVSLEDRFHGTCNLVILHLRRAAKSNDIEKGFDAAREMGMLSPEREAFIRRCLQLDETHDEPISDELVKQLQACILSLNTADPA
ncbi:MAG: hypothetical protein IJ087_08635 [Eggerthellaceae bacterium]|nr:hypothetical protein [Eggerthellaceae bacterium]